MSAVAEGKFTRETITWIHTWTPSLFSFRTTRPAGFRFTAGQFARLGVEKQHGGIAWRAYSMVSGPYDEALEFYSIVVPDGEFTSELSRLRVGDRLLIEKQNQGFLTLARFAGGKDLWLLSTGTGLAPFLSILSDPATWEHFENVVLVHSVRQFDELTYRNMIDGFREHEIFADHAHKLVYVPVVTRERIDGMLNARLTTLIANGALERQAGLMLDLDRSRIMLCGNPEMVTDTRTALKQRGFRTARVATPGQIAVENYW